MDGILHLSLLELAGCGNLYGKVISNAGIFWRSVLRGAHDAMAVEFLPSAYYHTVWEPAAGAEPVQDGHRITAY